MKRLLLLFMCWPLLLPAQNGVTLSNLVVGAGTATFDISWKLPMPPGRWSDTVWVFIDYSVAGKMVRMPLEPGATLTATSVPGIARVVEAPENNKGVWVVGNARSAGRFSATVQLLTSIANISGACVYASNYSPVGTYNTPTHISFSGSPMYDIVLKHTSGSTISVQSNSPYLLPAGYTPVSFVDHTGEPGVFGCVPMTGELDFSVPINPTKNRKTDFYVSSRPVAGGAPVNYVWSAPDFDPLSQSGTSGTFSTITPNSTGIYKVTLTATAPGYCNVSKTRDVKLGDCITPDEQDLIASATGFCTGGEGVVFALKGTQKDVQYQLYKDGAATGTLLTGSGAAATFTGEFNAAGTYSARVLDNNYCVRSMNNVYPITENPLPVAPSISQPSDICQHTGNITFTADGYSGALVWTSNGGGTEIDNEVTFAGSVTGTKTVVARSELTYSGAPACHSATVTRSATVNAQPVISAQPESQVFCETSAEVSLTVTAASGSGGTLSYQWKDGAKGGADVGTDSNKFTNVISDLSEYWVVITDSNGCAIASDKATITMSFYTGGIIGFGINLTCTDDPGKIGWK